MNVKDRNHVLLNLFKRNGFNAVRLIGNPNIPAVILFEDIVVSCHVVDNMVHFTDKPKDGNTIFSVDLTEDIHNLRPKLIEILSDYQHRKCYRIELVRGDLLKPLMDFYGQGRMFLKDYFYNHEDRNKYPVFLPGRDVKLYFEKEKAEEAIKKIYKVTPDIELEIV